MTNTDNSRMTPATTPADGLYRKKPVVIAAFKLGHDNMPDWFMDHLTANDVTIHNNDGRWRGGPDYALIKTLEGEMRAEYGDWIIRGVKGELYPCKPDIFAATYEPALATPSPGKAEAEQPSEDKRDAARCDVGHAHFTPFYLLSNCRRIVANEYHRKPNWAVATELFAVGSTTARRICRDAGIDPEAFEVRRAAIAKGEGK